jgi:ABC-type nickel/cobalt efflux system permease component RcnA
MGLAGGLLPSPTAVVVLLATVAVGKAWLGVLLVLAYGVGMATTLAGAGMLVARLRDRLDRAAAHTSGRLAAVMAVVPTLFAGTVVAVGLILATRGFTSVMSA